MNVLETLEIAFGNLKRQRTRSFLTILAIVIGMSSVVMFLLLGAGLQQKMGEQFRAIGTDKIYIAPGASLYGSIFGGVTSTLTQHDIELIDRISGVQRTTMMSYGLGRVAYKNEQKYTYIIGMLSEDYELFATAQGFHIEHGSVPRENEMDKVVVGWMFSEGKFFEKPVTVGKKLEIEGKTFEVAGTVSQIGNPSDDSQVYLQLKVVQDMFNKKDNYDLILVQTGAGANTSAIAEQIKEKLRKDRDLKIGEEDFSVGTTEDLIKSFNSIMSLLSVAVVGIASISLLVGGIGIMNTMYTSVLDRTQEIGVMKAIGATNNTIMLIFLAESGLLGLVGGIFSVIIGTALSYAASFVAETYFYTTLLGVYFNPTILIGVLLFSFGIGCISGVLPARGAAKMEPVEALRYE